MSNLPKWAQKPKHKKKVIATKRGWVVESTGELLSSHKDLDSKLKSLVEEVEALSVDVVEPTSTVDSVTDDEIVTNTPEPKDEPSDSKEQLDEPKTEPVKKERKKRGPNKKKKD